jgi:hypothetical protein
MSHRNRLDSNYAVTYELLAKDIPHARDINLKLAADVRQKISERKTKIQEHKNWIEQKSPSFFKRMAFVQKYVVNWNLDMPAICYPLHIRDLPRKSHTGLTQEERQKSLAKRKTIMQGWYCFFFGTEHLKDLFLEEL